MSPRIIHIPLSGGDRKAQAKGITPVWKLEAALYVSRAARGATTAGGSALTSSG
jgi:hypothetical protein